MRTPREEIERIGVAELECDWCGAKRNQRCRLPGGRPTHMHSTRFEDARAIYHSSDTGAARFKRYCEANP